MHEYRLIPTNRHVSDDLHFGIKIIRLRIFSVPTKTVDSSVIEWLAKSAKAEPITELFGPVSSLCILSFLAARARPPYHLLTRQIWRCEPKILFRRFLLTHFLSFGEREAKQAFCLQPFIQVLSWIFMGSNWGYNINSSRKRIENYCPNILVEIPACRKCAVVFYQPFYLSLIAISFLFWVLTSLSALSCSELTASLLYCLNFPS